MASEPNESHYHSKKDPDLRPRDPGALQPEGRARAPAVDAAGAQGARDQVHRRPADLQPPLRRAEGRHHADVPPASRGVGSGREVAEARPRERGGVLHPRRRGLRDPRRRALRLEGRRRRHRAQQLRAPALQRQPDQAGARARHEDEADVHVHEHAVSEDGGAAAVGRRRRAEKISASAKTRTTSTTSRVEVPRSGPAGGRHGVE